MVNGKRVKTVDVHAHCLFHEAEKLMGDDNAAFQSPMKEAGRQAFITATLDERLKAMDAQGVDMEVLSINPFWYRKDRDLAAEIVRVQNEKLAEFCASKPDRFAAFASLALQFPDLAVQQLETAMKKQGLRGAAIGGSVAGEEFADPEIPSGLGQGRRTRRRAVHPSADHPGTRQPAEGERLADQHDRPADRDHDRAVAPDLRGHARPLPRS